MDESSNKITLSSSSVVFDHQDPMREHTRMFLLLYCRNIHLLLNRVEILHYNNQIWTIKVKHVMLVSGKNVGMSTCITHNVGTHRLWMVLISHICIFIIFLTKYLYFDIHTKL